MTTIPNNELWNDFFLLLKELPELWKVKSDVFKDRLRKKNAWEKLLQVYIKIDPAANADSLKKRFANIKTCYRRELKKVNASVRSGAGAEDEYVPNLWYFDLLDFLRDHEVQIPGLSTLDIEEEGEYYFEQTEEDVEPVLPSTSPASCPPLKRKKTVAQQMAERNDLLKEALGQLTRNKDSENKDEASVFAESWAISFRDVTGSRAARPPPRPQALPPSPHLFPVERPYFDDVSPRNVTAVVGQTALLRCRVKHIGNRTVSWMRKRDLHILTSNIFTYTGDGRFSVGHPESSDDWNLRIEYVQARDAGIYECQVNTEPKINYAINLNVEAAQAAILGPEEVFVKRGSTISLTCSVNVHSQPPGSVLWYQGVSVVDFDSPRGGISLETEKTEAGTTSKLLVTKASMLDSGNYTCVPSNAKPASVYVHVLNGEHPAAMQHGEHGAGSRLVALSLSLFIASSVIMLS